MRDDTLVAGIELEDAAGEVAQLIREGWLEEQQALAKVRLERKKNDRVELEYHQVRELNLESVERLEAALKKWMVERKKSVTEP